MLYSEYVESLTHVFRSMVAQLGHSAKPVRCRYATPGFRLSIEAVTSRSFSDATLAASMHVVSQPIGPISNYRPSVPVGTLLGYAY